MFITHLAFFCLFFLKIQHLFGEILKVQNKMKNEVLEKCTCATTECVSCRKICRRGKVNASRLLNCVWTLVTLKHHLLHVQRTRCIIVQGLEDSLEHNLSFLRANTLQHHSQIISSANTNYLYMCITLNLQSNNELNQERCS